MTVTDEQIVVEDPTGSEERVAFDLRALAESGVLLPLGATLTLSDRARPQPARLQLRAVDPPSFDSVDWPPVVRDLVAAQLAASAAARAQLLRTLKRVVAGTVAGLLGVLALLVAVLLLT